VYATLTMAVMAAATGAYVHMFTDLLQGGGILLSLVGLGLAFGKPTIYLQYVPTYRHPLQQNSLLEPLHLPVPFTALFNRWQFLMKMLKLCSECCLPHMP
jgi:hypothetical protein